MAKLPSAFKADEVEGGDGFDSIPAGWIPAEITASEMVENSKKTGEFLKLEFTILGDKYANRKVWARLNLVNQSERAVRIANQELKSICIACGKESSAIEDSNVLHGIPMEIKLKPTPETDDFPAGNEIKGYRKSGQSAGAPPSGFGKSAPGADSAPAENGEKKKAVWD